MSVQTSFAAAFHLRLKSWNNFSDAQLALLTQLALSQAQHESANFTSNLCVNYNNCIGYTYYPLSRWQSGKATDQPEEPGINYYAAYSTKEDSARELADYIHRRYTKFREVKGVEDYANVMKLERYYTAPVSQYVGGMGHYYEPPGGNYSTEQPSELLSVVTDIVRPPKLFYLLAFGFVIVFWFAGWSFKKLFFSR